MSWERKGRDYLKDFIIYFSFILLPKLLTEAVSQATAILQHTQSGRVYCFKSTDERKRYTPTTLIYTLSSCTSSNFKTGMKTAIWLTTIPGSVPHININSFVLHTNLVKWVTLSPFYESTQVQRSSEIHLVLHGKEVAEMVFNPLQSSLWSYLLKVSSLLNTKK